MVGSEVDHKYLGRYAKQTENVNPVLSAGLYKLLGLSTLLSRKLLRARKQRKLDPTRSTKSLDLYRHIIWMTREGLTILQTCVLPELSNYKDNNSLAELQVLALKMNASFLHIFVLFDHTYATKTHMVPQLALPENGTTITTPALTQYAYMAPTIEAFTKADQRAKQLLICSHPLRLSVKLEWSAFTYDCTRDPATSRMIAKKAVDEAFNSSEPMEDEAFEDAMEMVNALGAMSIRGLPKSEQPQRHKSVKSVDSDHGNPQRHKSVKSVDSDHGNTTAAPGISRHRSVRSTDAGRTQMNENFTFPNPHPNGTVNRSNSTANRSNGAANRPVNGVAMGNGSTNGTANGTINGHANGYANGHTNGRSK